MELDEIKNCLVPSTMDRYLEAIGLNDIQIKEINSLMDRAMIQYSKNNANEFSSNNCVSGNEAYPEIKQSGEVAVLPSWEEKRQVVMDFLNWLTLKQNENIMWGYMTPRELYKHWQKEMLGKIAR